MDIWHITKFLWRKAPPPPDATMLTQNRPGLIEATTACDDAEKGQAVVGPTAVGGGGAKMVS